MTATLHRCRTCGRNYPLTPKTRVIRVHQDLNPNGILHCPGSGLPPQPLGKVIRLDDYRNSLPLFRKNA